MTTYVAMLRGVNVGGNALKMDWLREACEKEGLRDVQTYVQSGNIVFKAASNAEKLAVMLKSIVDAKTRLPVSVVVRNANQMSKIVAENVYLKRKGIDATKLHVTFLAARPATALDKTRLDKLAGDRDSFHLSGTEIYLHCPINYGQTKLSNTAIEKIAGVGATTRNWKTVVTLAEMATN
jgi:uncharacterized protein (DUF1697 family)